MAVNIGTPLQVEAAKTADQFVVTGYQVRLYDTTGTALASPTVSFYWMKRLSGSIVETGVTHGALSAYPAFNVSADATLQSLNVFPAG
jgi:hypothetical protein